MSRDTLRTMIGFGIVVVILIVWQVAFRPKPKPAAPKPATPAAETTVTPEVKPEPVLAKPVELERDPDPEPSPFAGDSAVAERTFVLENEAVRLEFSNLGGVLTSAWLERYDAELVPTNGHLLAGSVLLPDGPVSLAGVPMEARASGHSVTFSVESESTTLHKKFELGDEYTLTQTVTLTGADGYTIELMSGLAVTEKKIKDDLVHFHLYTRNGEKVQTDAAKKLKDAKSFEDLSWLAMKSKYFFIAAIAPEEGFDSAYATLLKDGRIGVNAVVGETGRESEMTFYLGPLEYDRLRSFGIGLEGAVSLGWAKPIALGILWLLRFLYKLVGNWGVAIMLFGVIMKAIFFPLTRIQTRQMRQMQLLQPKINELKKKYKDDAQALNQETMQLYKLYKVNPLSGCLPMLVQLPVFWALYSVLRTFIDLRGASFVFWLKDLSQPDTLFGHLPGGIPMLGGVAIGLLPVLMGLSFIAQNMLTSTDKKNWAMTLIFPIFITAIFLNFPSGLQLYWFTYNVLSIVESIIGIRGGRPWIKKREKKEPSLATAPSPK